MDPQGPSRNYVSVTPLLHVGEGPLPFPHTKTGDVQHAYELILRGDTVLMPPGDTGPRLVLEWLGLSRTEAVSRLRRAHAGEDVTGEPFA